MEPSTTLARLRGRLPADPDRTRWSADELLIADAASMIEQLVELEHHAARHPAAGGVS